MMIHQIGDNVIHCRNGVSTIIGTTEMGERQYFVIRALRGDNENIYVPIIGSQNIIRSIMTVEDADKLLHDLATVEKEFNSNTKQRRDAYKRRLGSGNILDIAYLYRQLYFYYQIGGEDNSEIKLGPVDIDMLSHAKNMLLDEFSLTYKVNRDDVEDFIEKRIKKL